MEDNPNDEVERLFIAMARLPEDEDSTVLVPERFRLRSYDFDCDMSGHASCCIDGTIVIWGGTGIASRSDDEEYLCSHIIKLVPTQMINKHDPIGIEALCASGDIPPPTTGAAMVHINGRLVIFGGHASVLDKQLITFVAGDSVNDTYVLSLTTSTWRKVAYDEDQPRPTPRSKMVAWAHAGGAYFFSGYGPEYAEKRPSEICGGDMVRDWAEREHMWTNQLLRFDIKINEWRLIETSGEIPSPRAAAAGCSIRNGSLVYVFGGRSGTQRLFDLYSLDMDSLLWTEIDMNPVEFTPIGRSWASLYVTEDARRVYIWGGLLDTGDASGELFEGDLVSGHVHSLVDNINARYWHTGHLCNGDIWAIGGIGSMSLVAPLFGVESKRQPPSLLSIAFKQITMESVRECTGEDSLFVRALSLEALVKGATIVAPSWMQDATIMDVITVAGSVI